MTEKANKTIKVFDSFISLFSFLKVLLEPFQLEIIDIQEDKDTLIVELERTGTSRTQGLEVLLPHLSQILSYWSQVSVKFSVENTSRTDWEKPAPFIRAQESNLKKYANSQLPILIYGETGVGKTTLARYIHEWSGCSGNLVYLNVSSIPETLLELSLFGNEKGAYTDGSIKRPGRIQEAQNGTLVLENLENIDLSVQLKLVDFLSSRQYYPLGAETPIVSNCRIIATSSLKPSVLLNKKTMLPSFIFLLNIIPFELPPLRDRKDELSFFCEEESSDAEKEKIPEFLEIYKMHMWPGNIREVLNTWRVFRLNTNLVSKKIAPLQKGYKEKIEDFKKEMLYDILQKNNGNQTKAAKELKIQRTYLAKLVKDYNIFI